MTAVPILERPDRPNGRVPRCRLCNKPTLNGSAVATLCSFHQGSYDEFWWRGFYPYGDNHTPPPRIGGPEPRLIDFARLQPAEDLT